MEDARLTATHLVVFQHGLLGSEADFANVHELFDRHLAHENVYAHTATCNATSLSNWSATCDGIDCGAERLAAEIVRLAGTMPQLSKFSIVGHSMGGLYARYCIGILYARGFFDKIEPVNFITLATPHLGNRRPQRGSVNYLYNAIAPRLFDRTGQQFALADEASKQAIALTKRAANRYPHRPSFAAYQELDGELNVCFEVDSSEFVLRNCTLRGGVFRCYESGDDRGSGSSTIVAQIDLLHSDVTVILPDKSSPSPQSAASLDWYVVVSQFQQSGSCTLRLPSTELSSQWKWVAALSNSACDVRCVTRGGSPVSSRWSKAPPLLCCLARGQFLQALQLFRVRTLYSTVFNDHTVPYSCASIRAFNPYRLLDAEDPSAVKTSPFYEHIVERSMWQAPLLRDTLPLDAKVTATRKSTAKFLLTKELANHQSSTVETESSTQPSTSSSSSSQTSFTSSLWSYFSSGASNSTPQDMAPMLRNPPFTDEHLLLDCVDEAFPTDEARDTLRSMLVTMQSVGWRRLDVRIDSLLAHEIIIGKRADTSDGNAVDGGLDIVHHMIDTFVLE